MNNNINNKEINEKIHEKIKNDSKIKEFEKELNLLKEELNKINENDINFKNNLEKIENKINSLLIGKELLLKEEEIIKHKIDKLLKVEEIIKDEINKVICEINLKNEDLIKQNILNQLEKDTLKNKIKNIESNLLLEKEKLLKKILLNYINLDTRLFKGNYEVTLENNELIIKFENSINYHIHNSFSLLGIVNNNNFDNKITREEINDLMDKKYTYNHNSYKNFLKTIYSLKFSIKNINFN